MTKCTFHKYGTSGNIENHDVLCILPLNIGGIKQTSRVATRIFEVFGGTLCKEFIIVRKPESLVHYIGIVAIGTLALPDKERNLSTRNQKVFKN